MASTSNRAERWGDHVGEIAGALKRTVEENFALVRVRGEVSGLKFHSSGHVYFDLKDDKAVLNAVIWRGTAALGNASFGTTAVMIFVAGITGLLLHAERARPRKETPCQPPPTAGCCVSP